MGRLSICGNGLSCFAVCGIFPDQGSNWCALHWQVDSYPLHYQGSPICHPLKKKLLILRASLVVQWLRICLARVQSLIQELRSHIPNTHTAISFSLKSGRGGPGLSLGWGEWQGGALRDGGGCPESVWGGEVCKSSNSGANGGSSQPTPRAGREGSAWPLPQASPTPTLGA